MFDKITIRENQQFNIQQPFDIGLILETLLFYQKSILVCDGPATLKQVINVFGVSNIEKLIECGALEINYSENMTIIKTDNMTNGLQYHDPAIATFSKFKFQDIITNICEEITGKSGKGRRLAKKYSKIIKVKNYDEKMIDGVRNQILDQDYFNKVAKLLISTWIPEVETKFVEKIKYETILEEQGVRVVTNVDYKSLNKIYHKHIPISHSSLDDAFIMSNLFDMENDLYHVSSNLSEIASTFQKSMLLDIRLSYLSTRCKKSDTEKVHFERNVVPGMKTIREEYDKGKINIDEIVNVICAASKFKKWLSNIPYDKSLLAEYIENISRTTFIEKLPSKSIRWGLFTGIGIAIDTLFPSGIGTASGIGLGLIDSFIIDKLLHGWKPNQFIEGKLLGIFKD
jgi:hypothetical protein